MKIESCKKPKAWNEFLTQQKMSQFLQSWEWGSWQVRLGKRVMRFKVVEDDKILAAFQLVQTFLGPRILKLNYFYLPRGPVFKDNLAEDKKAEISEKVIGKINHLCQAYQSIFWRGEFLNEIILSQSKKLKKVKDIQPSHTWFLRLEPEEDELLSNMHHKTRYNIRLAGRKGVEIKKAQNKRDIEKFFQALKATSKRNEFGIYSLEYYQNLFNLFKEETLLDDFTHPDVEVYLAEFEGKIIAGIWVMFFGDTATYLYGGMNKEFSKLMAPHLLQWTAIKEAKKRGYTFYDFWGVAPDGANKSHPWYGLTRFKKQFGGFEVDYPGCYQVVKKNFWCRVYRFLRK